MTSDPGPPIFLLGMMERTGTNYLWDLLTAHEAISAPVPIYEDALLRYAHHLADYVDDVVHFYERSPKWAVPPVGDALLERLGGGIERFLQERVIPGRRALAKTPSVTNLALFPRLFPDADLVVLVRDGRDVVESWGRTFGTSPRDATIAWATAATTILDFESGALRPRRYVRVRYEDLVDDVEGVLRAIFDVLGLDPSRYDFSRARDLPVRGSSRFRGGADQVHWAPVPKPEAFGASRWSTWDTTARRRFAWRAGDSMDALGYPLHQWPGRPTTGDRFAEGRDQLASVAGRARRHVRRLLAEE